MADTPQNPQNQGTPGLDKTMADLFSIKKLRQESLEIEGDYNNLTKQTLKELEKESKLYIKIAAKIEAMNQSSINVKEVQRELNKLTQKEFTDKKKIEQLQQELSEDTKKQIQNQKTLESLFSKAINEQQRERVQKQIDLNNAKLQANQELQYIEYQKAKAKITEQEKDNMVKILETETAVSREMGLTGKLAKNFADKLGLGESVYKAMVLQSRNNVEALRKGEKTSSVLKAGYKGAKDEVVQIWKGTSGWVKAGFAAVIAYKAVKGTFDLMGAAVAKVGSTLKGLSSDSSNLVSGLTSGVSSLLKNIPLVGGLLAGVVDGLSSIFDLIIGTDDRIVKAGRSLGMTADKARAFNAELSKAALSSGDIFMNSKKLLESQVELSNQLGINNQLSVENLQTNRMLKDFAGLEADTRAEIATSSQITGQSMEKITKSVVGQTAALQKTTGIAFNYQKILKEAASQSGYLGLQFAKYPEKLTKSLLTVKALGMDLKQLDSMADSLLDFESSISKEFEAQLLTGKNINLQKARELFLNNDLAGAAMEINKQVGSSEDFLKMNRFAAQSLAETFGMTRDTLGDMLKKQELYSKLGAKEGASSRELLKLATQRYHSQTELNAALTKEGYQSLLNASTQESIAEYIEKIKQSIVDFVQNSGIIDKIQEFVIWISKPAHVQKTLETVRNIVAEIADVIGAIVSGISSALNWAGFIDSKQYSKIANFTGGIGDTIRSFGGDLGTASKIETEDAVVLPGTNQVIKKDPQDYMFFAKNPQTFMGGSQNNQPQVIQVVLQADGEVLSKVNLKAQSKGMFYSTDTQTAPYDDQRG